MCKESEATITSFSVESNGKILGKTRLDDLLQQMVFALSKDHMRAIHQKQIVARMFSAVPDLKDTMKELRKREDFVQHEIFLLLSKIMRKVSKHAAEPMLVMKGLLKSGENYQTITSERKREHIGLACLDTKDRIKVMLEFYGWTKQFHRWYPVHEHENGFGFLRLKPEAPKLKVHVVGLGVGGSFAASGLSKAGMEVTAFEKRDTASVGSRYQTASSSLYESARELVDDIAFQELVDDKQTMHIDHPDGGISVFQANRCTTVLGGTIDTCIRSAQRGGAKVKFNTNYLEHQKEQSEQPDLVAVFCGAHTSKVFDIEKEMGMITWPEVNSDCHLWLEINESKHTRPYTKRDVAIGAEKWHYIIETARTNTYDIERATANLDRLHKQKLALIEENGNDESERKAQIAKYEEQLKKMERVSRSMSDGGVQRFDYVFGSAPRNEGNDLKLQQVEEKGNLVIDGYYIVQPTFALRTTFTEGPMLPKFGAKLVTFGGDAAVAPNPLAARGATVACDNAFNLVQMAVGLGHVNVMLDDMKHHEIEGLMEILEKLKALLPMYYEAFSQSQNFFQWVQTIVTNLYSLPPKAETLGDISGQWALQTEGEEANGDEPW